MVSSPGLRYQEMHERARRMCVQGIAFRGTAAVRGGRRWGLTDTHQSGLRSGEFKYYSGNWKRFNKVVLKANKKHSICLFHCIPELTEAFLLPTGYRQFRWIRNVFSRRSEVGRKVNQGRMKQNLLSFSPDSYLKPTSTVTVVTF